jgi:hypothetical protein
VTPWALIISYHGIQHSVYLSNAMTWCVVPPAAGRGNRGIFQETTRNLCTILDTNFGEFIFHEVRE